MYGLFQDGALSAREPLRAELDLTRRSIAALQASTTAKTYAIRLRVAEVQTAEMMSDLFGQPPAEESASIAPSPMPAATNPNLSAGPAPIAFAESPGPVQRTTSAWLAGAFWYRRSLAFRVAAGLVLCLVAAVLIVVPVAIMALFPNHLTEIAVAYALIAFVWWLWRRNQPGIQHSGREEPFSDAPHPRPKPGVPKVAKATGSIGSTVRSLDLSPRRRTHSEPSSSGASSSSGP